MIKVDCHVHSMFSSNFAEYPLTKFLSIRESYNTIEEIYKTAKARGMDFVAITDHDEIEGALRLAEKYPNETIVGEELTVADGDYKLHVVCLNITEKDHKKLGVLKNKGLEETASYLQKNRIPYFLAHIGWFVRGGKRPDKEIIEKWLNYFYAVETINGTRARENVLANLLAVLYKKTAIGGGDSHTYHGIGKTYTIAEKAKTKAEFLEAIISGECYAAGESSCFSKALKDVGSVIFDSAAKQVHNEKYFNKVYASLKFALLTPIMCVIPVAVYGYLKSYKKKTIKLEDEFFMKR